MSQISTISRERVNVAAINLDGNNLSTLHGIKQFPSLVQVTNLPNTVCMLHKEGSCNIIESLSFWWNIFGGMYRPLAVANRIR